MLEAQSVVQRKVRANLPAILREPTPNVVLGVDCPRALCVSEQDRRVGAGGISGWIRIVEVPQAIIHLLEERKVREIVERNTTLDGVRSVHPCQRLVRLGPVLIRSLRAAERSMLVKIRSLQTRKRGLGGCLAEEAVPDHARFIDEVRVDGRSERSIDGMVVHN